MLAWRTPYRYMIQLTMFKPKGHFAMSSRRIAKYHVKNGITSAKTTAAGGHSLATRTKSQIWLTSNKKYPTPAGRPISNA